MKRYWCQSCIAMPIACRGGLCASCLEEMFAAQEDSQKLGEVRQDVAELV